MGPKASTAARCRWSWVLRASRLHDGQATKPLPMLWRTCGPMVEWKHVGKLKKVSFFFLNPDGNTSLLHAWVSQFVWICIWILVYELKFLLVTQSQDSYDSVFNTWGSSSLGHTNRRFTANPPTPLNRQTQLSQFSRMTRASWPFLNACWLVPVVEFLKLFWLWHPLRPWKLVWLMMCVVELRTIQDPSMLSWRFWRVKDQLDSTWVARP